jgi:hypothetical protein
MKSMQAKRLMLVMFIISLASPTIAQEKIKIENVQNIYLRNSGAIFSNREVKGYFFFFMSDKINKVENEYTLKLTDQNLNPAKEIKFTDSKDVLLLESAFNGKDIVFQFYNRKESYMEYKIYSPDGKLKNSYTKEFDKKSKAYFERYIEMQEESKSLFPLGNVGFASVLPVRDGKKYSYEVNFFLSDRKKQVAFNPEDEEKLSQAQYIGSTDSILLIQVMKKAKMLSNNLDSWLIGFNVITGKKVFEMETVKDYNFYPMNVSAIKNSGGNYMLMGPYFEKNERAGLDRSLGLGIWVMDAKGNVVSQKYNGWDGQLGKVLPVDAKGKVDDLGYVFVHSVVRASNGNIFAIGEGYKKQASVGGIAGKLVGAGTSAAKIRTTDMVMMQFDKDFNITGAKIYDKTNNDVYLPNGAEFLNAPSLALMIKALGDFDYNYTMADDNVDEFVVGYSDYERSGDFKGLTFNTIRYDGQKISQDKLSLNSKASSMQILPAKIGSILVLEYFKKDKRLDVRIEKIN